MYRKSLSLLFIYWSKFFVFQESLDATSLSLDVNYFFPYVKDSDFYILG